MMGSPLIWMEMSHLREEDAQALERIISVYRGHQENIVRSTVEPIGHLPDGVHFTGFHAKTDGESGYLLFFRGIGREDEYVFDVPALKGKNVRLELLASNAEPGGAEAAVNENGVRARMAERRTYAFWKYMFI